MEIKVRLFATLREKREKEFMVVLSNSSTVRDLIDSLEIKESEVAILLVNGLDAKLDRQLLEKDVVSIFPPVGGG
jgi:molybdopterin converting factor small subunit